MTEHTSAVRRTRQHDDVRAALTAAGEFRTAQKLHVDMHAGGSRIGLTTVYRVLQLLADSGEADMTRPPTGERLYRRCDTSIHHHHHHLVCRRCGHAVEIEDLGVDVRTERLATEHGFTDVAHTVEMPRLAEGPLLVLDEVSLVAGLDEIISGAIDAGGHRVSMMFQEPTLFPWLTVARNVEIALRSRGLAVALAQGAGHRHRDRPGAICQALIEN